MELKLIKAKFESQCAETGARIPKGVNCYWNPATKKVYCQESQTVDQFVPGIIHEGLETGKRESLDPAAGMIQAEQEAYFDNFCQQNNI